MIEIEVHIDESGLFVETSTAPEDRVAAHKQAREQGRKFASQLAGVFFTRRQQTDQSAESILCECCKRSELEFSHQFHANKINDQTQYSKLIVEFCNQLKSNKIQPFRIANEEQVSFGDRISNYTNILAELLLRICHTLSKVEHESISLYVTAAKVFLREDKKGELHFMERDDYLSRIHEYFARAAVRKGYGSQSKKWKVESFRIGSAQVSKVLQLSDIVSNASHDHFHRCDSIAESCLKASFAEFDWTLSSDEFFDEVNNYIAQNSFGLALISMAQRAVDLVESNGEIDFNNRMNDISRRFCQLPGGVRLPQMKVLVSWLQQGIESRTDLAFSIAASHWVRDRVGDSLSRHGGTHDILSTWLEFATTSLLITANNHLGKTIETTKESARLDNLIPRLAGRWEYSSDIMEGLVAQAVHLNDCFEHQKVVEKMDLVAGFFETLSGFFKEAFVDVFPEDVQSDLWGKALGTKVQSETFLALQNKIDLEQVRSTSDAAIEQFALLDDKYRQYQYRSEIEAIASNWESARTFLAMSLGLEENTHESIAKTIAAIDNKFPQGFALLHWTRLGGIAAAKSERNELHDFTVAFKSQRFDNHPWIQGQFAEYPTHSILRRIAVIKAAGGDRTAAVQTLNRLRKITTGTKVQAPVFTAILVAALVEVAAFLFKADNGSYRELLSDASSQKPGAIQTIGKLILLTKNSQSAIANLFAGWDVRISAVLEGNERPSVLAELGRQIGY